MFIFLWGNALLCFILVIQTSSGLQLVWVAVPTGQLTLFVTLHWLLPFISSALWSVSSPAKHNRCFRTACPVSSCTQQPSAIGSSPSSSVSFSCFPPTLTCTASSSSFGLFLKCFLWPKHMYSSQCAASMCSVCLMQFGEQGPPILFIPPDFKDALVTDCFSF